MEDFFNHQLMVWEWLLFSGITITLREIIRTVWRKGKKKGVTEYDDYKKWEARFKDEGKLK